MVETGIIACLSLLIHSLECGVMTTLHGVNGTVCNATQYFQSLQSGVSNKPSISCLTRGESIGLVLAAELSLVAFVSSSYISGLADRKTYWTLFQRPADIYMFSLFVFDLLQAIGGKLNIRWAHSGIITTGQYCTAQGVTQQIGEIGVAPITILLAIHTFVAALWQVGLQARGVALGMVCLACIFIVPWVAVGSGVHKFYGKPTPYWCWISPQFPGDHVGNKYISLWLALFALAILYIPLYFWAEGRLSVGEEGWYKFQMSDSGQRVGYAQRRVALGMLLYPLASSIVLLPLFIPRCLLLSRYKVSSWATFFGDTMFNLSGAIDVLLFLNVRRHLLLFPRPETLAEPDIELAPQGTRLANFSEHSLGGAAGG